MASRLIAFILRWLILAAAVWVAAWLLPGIRVDDWQSALAVALVLGVLNVFIKPVLVLLSLPITILTLGLFLIIINTALLLLAEWLVTRLTNYQFAIDGFLDALLGALIISVVTFIVTRFISPEGIARSLIR